MRLPRARHADAQQVVRGLWVGSAPLRRDVDRLVGLGVDAIVDLRAEGGDVVTWPPEVEVQNVPLVDHAAPSTAQLEEAGETVAALMRRGREVLVHCHAGIERAPTVACAALVIIGWGLRDAYDAVLAARPSAHPTEGQLMALRRFAEEHR